MLNVFATSAIVLALVFPSVLPSQELTAPQQDSPRLNLDSLVAEAIQNNPQLRASRNQTASARTRISQVTAWDPPQIGVEFYQTPIRSFPNPISNGMETDYFIQQMIPFPGKLSAMGRAAEKNADMVNEAYTALKRRIVRELKSAYFELFHVQRKIQVNIENQELMKEFTEIARKQYEVGTGQQADILRSQTELSSLINEGVNLLKEKKVVESMINTLLSRPVNAPLGSVPDVQIAAPRWTFEQLHKLALESRAELKGMGFTIDMAKAELSVSKREYYPDIMTRLMYKNMSGTTEDYWSAMVGVNIPIAFWSSGKYTSKVEENELNLSKAEDDLANMRNMVSFEVQDALVKVQSDYNLLLLYKNTTVPQAEQTLQATLSAYQTGKTEFLAVIDASRMQLTAKLDYHMAVTSYMASEAQLEQAVGLDIAQISERDK